MSNDTPAHRPVLLGKFTFMHVFISRRRLSPSHHHHAYLHPWMPVTTVVWMLLIGVIGGCATELERRFQSHIDYLASDALEGRGPGTRGLDLAAGYIADRFQEIGLEPAGDNGTYYQTFDMTLKRILDASSHLSFNMDPEKRRLGGDYIPFSFSSDEPFSADVVFCGYGIVAPEHEHDDFVHVDVKGKAVLILRGEPPAWADENGFSTRRAMLRNKVYNAKDQQAAVVIIVNQKPEPGESDRLVEFGDRQGEAYGIPAFHVTRAMVERQFQRLGLPSLNELQSKLDAGGYVSQALPGLLASGQAIFHEQQAPVKNVIGLLRARDASANEYVVVGAHYDHLGIRKPMRRTFRKGKLVSKPQKPQVHNGADDNASGTSGLIEVARMLAADPPAKRNVLFIAFTAEETGLHGSTYYAKHPSVPLADTVAMLNMDMIGRMKPHGGALEIFGVGTSPSFEQLLTDLARSQNLNPIFTPGPGGRSDHAAFARRKIPVLHFFSGQHADYHQPGDDSNKINARDGARITAMVGRMTQALADRDERPAFQEVKTAQEGTPGDTPTYRVVMGLAPGYGDDGKPGMRVEAVSPEGPADQAGMKAGDRIIRIEDKKVANIYDYMAATRHNNPGDTVNVVVLRNGRRHTLKVTLSGTK